ncbi:MAG: hypothetical protein HZB18_13165 [Chloroflexi bacterium]|nr:hypothetical protein [Chloroflexota bacterium]
MKKLLISSIIFSVFILTSCLSPLGGAPVQTVTIEASVTPSLTPTTLPTETPTQTPIPTYSEDQLSAMSDEERLSHAPDEIGEFTKSNVSENKNNIIVYRDADGTAQMTFDLTTAKELTLPEAGIVEIPLTTGEYFEVLGFSKYATNEFGNTVNISGQEAINHAAITGNATGTTMDMDKNPNMKIFYEKYKYNIPGWTTYRGGGKSVYYDKEGKRFAFSIYINSYKDSAIITFMDKNNNFHIYYVDEDPRNLSTMIGRKDIIAPDPIQ